MKKIFTAILFSSIAISSFAQPIAIGNTTFDFQSYWGNHNRIIAYPDDKVSAAWIGSDGFGASFSDRGMFFNHFNGVAWGTFPTGRIEGEKTYFGELIQVLNHEVIISDEATRLLVHENSTIGANDWNETDGSNVIDGYNPMAFCPAGTDDIYVVNTKKITFESLLFSRSDDGGQTWAVNEYVLPFTEEAYGIELVNPDSYQIVADGNDVYVLYGANFCDMILMHSPSNGAAGTWTSQVLVNFPIDNFTGAAGQTTDYDGDGDKDTISVSDGMVEMIIEDDGTVHVFSGHMLIYDPTVAAGYFYIPRTDGMWYWTTGMASAVLLDVFIDWDNTDGLNNPYAGIGTDFTAYYAEGVTTMPTAAWDPDLDRVYMMYIMPVEYNISDGNQTFYDIFGIYSDDDGATWTDPINLTYTTHLDHENVYPSAYPRVVDGKIHVQWQQDFEPGTSQDSPSDDIVVNNILYVAWDEARFEPYNPTVDFTYTLAPIGASYLATFTNLSVDAENYLWEFGDGGTSTLINPTHTYAAGEYEVCLTGFNVYGEATVCQMVVAVNDPVADFTSIGDPEVAFIDLSTGDPTTWFWNFGDGFTSTESDPVHTFLTNGTFNVCLTVSNLAGSDTHCENVIIDSYIAPTAYFVYSGDPVVTFTDLSIGGPTSWYWNFDDGTFSTLQNPVHTFTENGVYNVCLTATNGVGSSTSCQNVTIDSYATPITDFSFTGDPTVTFTDLSTEDPFEWFWDFGDATTSTLQNPIHTFTTNGSFDVCLTATNAIGSNIECKVVVIDGYLTPVAIFDYTGDPTVTFTDLSTNSPTSWFWNFGDGTFSAAENPIHTYAENGVYNVCLTVTSPGGVDEGCEEVTINNGLAAPVANFSSSIGGALTVTFTDLSTNTPTDWAWDFGDGTISGLQNPTHAYATLGAYNVCLTAANAVSSDTYCDVIDLTSAINNYTITNIQVFPNPTNEFIQIELNTNVADAIIEIINVNGQKVIIDAANIISNADGITINVKQLPSANYFVVIKNSENTYIGKFFRE